MCANTGGIQSQPLAPFWSSASISLHWDASYKAKHDRLHIAAKHKTFPCRLDVILFSIDSETQHTKANDVEKPAFSKVTNGLPKAEPTKQSPDELHVTLPDKSRTSIPIDQKLSGKEIVEVGPSLTMCSAISWRCRTCF